MKANRAQFHRYINIQSELDCESNEAANHRRD